MTQAPYGFSHLEPVRLLTFIQAVLVPHTLLWYDRYGADVFRRLAQTRRKPAEPRPGKRRLPPRRDLEQVWQRARENETEIWRILVTEKRTVTREAYRRLAEALPSVRLTTS